VAVVDGEDRLVASAGAVDGPVFYRSAAKPLQALPLVEDGVVEALGVTDAELALCCASHSGEERHVEGVRRILARAGVGEEALACGPHPPLAEDEAERLAAAGRTPRAIHNNCSGKHAGMIALASHHGWPTAGYLESSHPVQRRMLGEVARWSGVPEEDVGTGVDGCGVVCFAVPLRAMARSFARFGRAAGEGHDGPARILSAMAGHPGMVAGDGRLCTVLMDTAGDRLVVKTGAEGVYGGLIRPGRGGPLGIALKAEDGARRASEVAVVRVLELLGALAEEELSGPLGPFRGPVVRNTLGHPVGRVEADFELEGVG
jgi:L-asparaginase II